MSYKTYSRNCDYCGNPYIGVGKFYCSHLCHVLAEKKPLETKFWDKVLITDLFGCWLWTACKDKQGYGQLVVPGKGSQLAHRISYIINIGPIPDGLGVLHKCNNPPCVSPAHLYLGTQQDNVDYMIKSNRQRSLAGEEIGSAKLTEKEADEIILLLKNHTPRKNILKMYNVGSSQLHRIKKGEAWKHIPR